MKSFWLLLFILAFAAASPVRAQQPPLQQRVEAELARATETRFGLVVADEAGRELIAIQPDGRFLPASNTKLLPTIAAYARSAGINITNAVGAAVALRPQPGGRPDVVLSGAGDAGLSSAADCVTYCLAQLADAVAAKTKQVGNVIGDATLFADERWSPGMSWNNIHTRSGTAVSALNVDDNELVLRVSPGAAGQPPTLDHLPYYRIVNGAKTVAAQGNSQLSFTRLPGSDLVHLTGTITAGAEPVTLRLGIDDPAHYAAWRMRALLEARGVRVGGKTAAQYRAPGSRIPFPFPAHDALARLNSPSTSSEIVRINKESHNLRADLLLRKLGLVVIGATGSIGDGVQIVEHVMDEAGVLRTGWDISDGSGMSTYNRLSPRAVVKLLRWAAAQPWGAQWRQSLPVAGVDGTLARRFRGTSLERRLFAKTGALNATNALSGYMIARSGRTLTFSFFANDIPGGGGATATMDAALQLIADSN